ncbi:MAG: tRNA uridine-5-carboxymethylaminomethyl(34) synthesis GTPase MnmE [bacterium]|nr:tRNA uridine-5-carboxymethylaminomethyl(34) synthesis GTPase MnmE [bacterium]
MPTTFSDTIAAISTPLGESGIGIVRISGVNALAIVSQLFRDAHPQPLHLRPSHTVYHGRIFNPKTNTELDEVVITIFRAPHSYTTEDIVEISAHGSPLVLRQILNLVLSLGARLAEPGEFTKRAFLAGRIDLIQAEAVIDLIQSQTELAQRAALQQLEGRLSEQLRQISHALMDILTEIEAQIDFPEEDIPQGTYPQYLARIHTIQSQLTPLLNSARFGRKLREGVNVPLIGKPNVGKSSLLNAFLQEPRAIVTPHPGTTRDTIHETINLNGIPFEFIDTAGWRETDDVIEQEGVKRTRNALKQADIILVLFDNSQPLSTEDLYIIEQVKLTGLPMIAVINKIDLPNNLAQSELFRLLPDIPIVKISAVTGEGIPQLETMLQTLISAGEAVSSADAVWVTNIRHAELLRQSLDALTVVEQDLTQNQAPELIAAELRQAIAKLGEILGTNITADLLDRIFSRFCIGK